MSAPLEVHSFPDPLPYREAWALQQAWHARRVAGEIGNRLLLLEHPPVYTLGRRLHPEHVLDPQGIELVQTDRGGDVTYHGPGQLVAYPIIGLPDHDLRAYLRRLEELLIRLLAGLGLAGERIPGKTGVWVGGKKIAAIGVRVSRWVTLHGFALNWRCDLAPFERIVACGITGARATSLRELGVEIEREDLEARLLGAWDEVL